MEVNGRLLAGIVLTPMVAVALMFAAMLAFAPTPEETLSQSVGSVQASNGGRVAPTQSLALNLSGQRVATATISDMDVGNDPTVAFTLRMYSSDPAGNPAQIEKLVLDGITCTTMDFNMVEVYQGAITNNTFDGASYSGSVTSSVNNIILASDRGAENVGPHSGSTIDRIDLQVDGMEADEFILRDIRTDGACEFVGLDVGEIDHRNSFVGDGSGISNASWAWSATSTQIGPLVSYTDNTDDKPFLVR